VLKNYFRLAIRNILKRKAFSAINIVGLTAGMTVCFLILNYAVFELSFDRFHRDVDTIVRLRGGARADSSGASAPSFKEAYPEVLNYAKVCRAISRGVYSDLEYSMIKVHAQVGYTILSKIDFPWPIARIVHEHHELVNGSGYPQGLSGKDILLEAKIICVADVVEAMSSHRPYRPALGIGAALDEITQKRGILFEREVVDACLRLFREKHFKFD
jgi:hypothetical protein